MSERSNPGPVVGWRDGKFLYSAPGGRMMDALGVILDDKAKESDDSPSDVVEVSDISDGKN